MLLEDQLEFVFMPLGFNNMHPFIHVFVHAFINIFLLLMSLCTFVTNDYAAGFAVSRIGTVSVSD